MNSRWDGVRRERGSYFNHVGFSAGISYSHSDELGVMLEKHIARADKALYAAKNSGKGCIGVYHMDSEKDGEYHVDFLDL